MTAATTSPPTSGVTTGSASRGARWALSTGPAAVVLVLAGHFVHGSVPQARADVGTVVAFYRAHDGRIYVGSILIALAAFAFIAFAALLRGYLRGPNSMGDTPTALAFGGATVFTVGLTLTAGTGVALGHRPAQLDPTAIQALHALFFDMFAPIGIGIAAFLIGNGVAIINHRRLPAWLGWSGIAIGTVALFPEPVGDIGLAGLGLWTIAATAALWTWSRRQSSQATVATGDLVAARRSLATRLGRATKVSPIP